MQTRPELEALIAGIRQQIERSESAIEDLQESRQTALLAGDSARLDEIEIEGEQHRKENSRRAERIALLEAELVAIDQRDHATYIESIRQRAVKAAQLGEEIIRKEYAVSAKKIGAALEKLAVLRSVIADANRALDRAGGEQVHDFDANRHVPGWQPPPVTELVTINAQDCRHPRFEEYRGAYQHRTAQGIQALLDRIGTVEIEETKTPRWEGPTHAESLEDNVNLPGVVGTDLYFWRGEWWRHGHQGISDSRREEIRKALLGDEPPALTELAERAPSIRERLASVVDAIARPLRAAGRM